MPPRHTNHQREMRAHRDRIEAIAQSIILDELQRLWRGVRSKVKRLDAQRPTLAKVNDFTPEPDLWEQFQQRLEERLNEALADGILTLATLEASFMAARTGDAVIVDSATIAASFAANLGQRIVGINEASRASVSRLVTSWYNKPGSTLQEAIDALMPVFGEGRAEVIARTEITRLNSGVQEEIARAANVTEWVWSTRNDQTVCVHKKRWMRGPDGALYFGCRELHGRVFQIGQPMPPESSHPQCRCSPVLVIPPRKPQTVDAPVYEYSQRLHKTDEA